MTNDFESINQNDLLLKEQRLLLEKDITHLAAQILPICNDDEEEDDGQDEEVTENTSRYC